LKVIGELSLLNVAVDVTTKLAQAFPEEKVSLADPLSRADPDAELPTWLKKHEINTLKSP
jgi:hypothetical protein